MPASADDQWRIISSGAAEVVPAEELQERLRSGDRLRVKLGVDPTAEHIHLGWAVPLRKLRQFQDLGHTAVLILGDFTARIGDPSGQNVTRPMLTREQVDAYVDRVLGQLSLILAEERLEVRRNSEWLEPLGVEGVLRLGAQATVAQMLQRNDFAERFAAQSPISVTEFLYPLLQGYDSVAVEADVELGGTDQTFNLLVGRDLQQRAGQRPQTILTLPLLEGTDGVKKMSQSLGNYIAVTEAPEEMFGKLMRVPDELLVKYLRLATDLDPAEVDAMERQLSSGELRPDKAKRRLAGEVVRLYHGPTAAVEAEDRFDLLFKEHGIPADVPEAAIPSACVEGGILLLPCLLKELGLASSLNDARRVIAQGGLRIDGEIVRDEEVALDGLAGRVVQRGKRQFVRLV